MPRTRWLYREGDAPYFITNTIIDRLPIFRDPVYCEILIASLKFLRKEKRALINDYVIMPTHMHAILWPQSACLISDVMRDFKRYSSRAISEQLERDNQHGLLMHFALTRPGKGHARYRIWQQGYHPEIMLTTAFCNQKMEYIHNNPLNAGLVDDPIDWKYSGARNYCLGDDSVIELDRLEL
jgi:REP-associated tyrosine transposase